MKDWRTVVGFILAGLMILYMVYTVGRVKGYGDCADYVVEKLKTRKTSHGSGTADSVYIYNNKIYDFDGDSLPVDSTGKPINPGVDE